MPVLLVRHAQAVARSSWSEVDGERPLSRRGRKQSNDLVVVLAEFKPWRVVSSPYLRCMETVAPLAAALGLPVEPNDGLAEGSNTAAVHLVQALAAEDVVLCSHGDVIPAVLRALDAEYDLGLGASPRIEKASTWMFETGNGRFNGATYIRPPRG